MTCPLCNYKIHEAAEVCPHCGRDAEDLVTLFDRFETKVYMLNDAAGVFKIKERRKIESLMNKFTREFPECFLTIHTVGLINNETVGAFSIWALNCPEYLDYPGEAQSDSGIALVIDLNKKQVTISFGYQLEHYFDKKASFKLLTPAHPHLLDEAYYPAVTSIIKKLRITLALKARISKHILRRKNLLDHIRYA